MGKGGGFKSIQTANYIFGISCIYLKSNFKNLNISRLNHASSKK